MHVDHVTVETVVVPRRPEPARDVVEGRGVDVQDGVGIGHRSI
jgi:hypothetical protein